MNLLTVMIMVRKCYFRIPLLPTTLSSILVVNTAVAFVDDAEMECH